MGRMPEMPAGFDDIKMVPSCCLMKFLEIRKSINV